MLSLCKLFISCNPHSITSQISSSVSMKSLSFSHSCKFAISLLFVSLHVVSAIVYFLGLLMFILTRTRSPSFRCSPFTSSLLTGMCKSTYLLNKHNLPWVNCTLINLSGIFSLTSRVTTRIISGFGSCLKNPIYPFTFSGFFSAFMPSMRQLWTSCFVFGFVTFTFLKTSILPIKLSGA